MKKITLLSLFICFSAMAFGQILPSFQLGIKGGANLSKLSTSNTFSSDNSAGYYAGIWTRIGAAGLYLQPELYLSGKNTTLVSNTQGTVGEKDQVKFTSLDVPFLIGTKIGAAGIGIRLNTGPVVSFILDNKQSFGAATSDIFSGDFKKQTFAWQFGGGLDLGAVGIDLRYEAGITKIGKSGYDGQKLNLFTLGLAFKLF